MTMEQIHNNDWTLDSSSSTDDSEDSDGIEPTTSSAPRKRARYTCWKKDDVMTLLGIWSAADIRAKVLTSNANIYETIAERVWDAGLTKTLDQIRSKMSKLRAEYHKARRQTGGADSKLMDQDFYKVMDEVLCKKYDNDVTAVLNNGSDTVNSTGQGKLAMSTPRAMVKKEFCPTRIGLKRERRKGEYASWKRADVLKLLDIMSEADIQKDLRAKSNTVFAEVVDKAHDIGIYYSRVQIRSKFTKLRRHYDRVKEQVDSGIPVDSIVGFDLPIFNMMSGILGSGTTLKLETTVDSLKEPTDPIVVKGHDSDADTAANNLANDFTLSDNLDSVKGEPIAQKTPNSIVKKRLKYTSWTRADTVKLLEIWRRSDIQSKIRSNFKKVYLEITAMARDAGLKLSTEQLKRKIRKLQDIYYAVKEFKKNGGRDVKMDPIIYRIMDSVLSGVPKTQPRDNKVSGQSYPVSKPELPEMITIFADTDVWTCLSCPALFIGKTLLDEHKERAHSFSCVICGSDSFTFPDKETFVTHFVMHHGAVTLRTPVLWDPHNSNSWQQAIDGSDLQPATFEGGVVCSADLVKCEIESVHDEAEHSSGMGEEFGVMGTDDVGHISFNNVTERKCFGAELITKLEHKENKLFKSVEFKKEGHQSERKDTLKQRLSNGGMLNCPICKATFAMAKGLFIHVKVHHKGNAELQSRACNSCFIVFAKRKHLKKHKRRVHAPGQQRLNADKLRGKNKQKEEMSNVTWNERGCRECNKLFKFRRVLVGHMQLVHNIKIPLESQNSNLRAKELAERAIICCEICGIEIQTRNMKKHLLTHNQSRTLDHKCPHENCSKSYGRVSDLNVHIRASHKEAQICPHCGEKFRGAGNLRVHLQSVHGDRKFKCTLCDREFAAEFKLRRHHTVVHLRKTKTWVCQYCGKSFNMKRYYVDHINLHTKEKTFFCELCSKEFSQVGQLKNHRRTAHGVYKKTQVIQK